MAENKYAKAGGKTKKEEKPEVPVDQIYRYVKLVRQLAEGMGYKNVPFDQGIISQAILGELDPDEYVMRYGLQKKKKSGSGGGGGSGGGRASIGDLSPTIIKAFQDGWGVDDIRSYNPSVFNYAKSMIASGKWDASKLEMYIFNSPQGKQRRRNVYAEELRAGIVKQYKVDPSDPNIQPFLAKKESGYVDQQIIDWLRTLPEYQTRFPGIRTDETPVEYDSKIAQLNAYSLEYRGRSFDVNNPEDLDVLKRTT